MKLKFLFICLCLLQISAHAADEAATSAAATSTSAAPNLPSPPAGVRPRGPSDPRKESSSLMGDADNLDQLETKKENLKTDEEPVLEDIREVLNEPEKKPKVETIQTSNTEGANKKIVKKKVTVKKSVVVSPAKVKKISSSTKTKKASVARIPKKQNKSSSSYRPSSQNSQLTSDDPDFRLEKKFNTLYKQYNSVPTSVEAWSTVLNNRPAQIYVVQKGDTLWSISKTLFGDPLFWPKIWALNRMGIVNPHFITPGLKVLFYSGTEENAPSLAVGSKSSTTEEVTESDAEESSSEVKKITSKSAGVIPDSLPLSRNDNYFLPPKLMSIELKNDVDTPEEFENDILLTDKVIKSEIELGIGEVSKGRCGGTHVIKGNDIIQSSTPMTIFEPLEKLDTDVGEVHAYRYVGQAIAYAEHKMKITKCTTVMSESLVYISADQVSNLKTNKISKIAAPELMGGPNLGTQILFSNKQLVYLNLGTQVVNIGQSVFVHSNLTEQTSGEIKILEKFGSFAIGALTEVDDLIEKGDMITLER